jgi:hypothetical protein
LDIAALGVAARRFVSIFSSHGEPKVDADGRQRRRDRRRNVLGLGRTNPEFSQHLRLRIR